MKNIVAAIATAIILLATACAGNEARKQLAAEIEAANRSYPVSLGLNGVCNSITYDASENAVTIEYIITDLLKSLNATTSSFILSSLLY